MDRLWADKVYVPAEYVALRHRPGGGRGKAAYRQSRRDAARSWLTEAELLSAPWSFRFAAQAGEGWTRGDPFWHGRRPRQFRFCADRTVTLWCARLALVSLALNLSVSNSFVSLPLALLLSCR